jgi:hypothetical protein
MDIRTVMNLCDEEEQPQLEGETMSDIQLDNGITISVGDIEIRRFANRDKNYMNYTV